MKFNIILNTQGLSPIFCHESWQNDICSFRAMNVTITLSVKLKVFNIYKHISEAAMSHLSIFVRSVGTWLILYVYCW